MTRQPIFADDLILSVHIPKAAGITLWDMLNKAFVNHIATYYPDRDPWAECTDPVKVIHGHFELRWYLDAVPNPRVIAFLREPLSRAISHFNYWCHPGEGDPLDHPLYKEYFQDQEPDLNRFLLAPEMGNIMTSFLLPFDRPEQFFFIGFQETFGDDIETLQRLLGIPYQPQPHRNSSKVSTSQNIRPEVRSAFYKIHAKDTDFYQRALKARRRRTNWIFNRLNRLRSMFS